MTRRTDRKSPGLVAVLLAAGLLAAGCSDIGAPPAQDALNLDLHKQRGPDHPPSFSDWSAPVNLGPVVNFELSDDAGAFISKDGLRLFFGSYGRPDGYGEFDLYVSRRAHGGAAWGPPENLGPDVNSSANEQTPALSPDGHRLYFGSDRADPGAFGGMDLYEARRHSARDDFRWRPPVNLGEGVNTPYNEMGPSYLEDNGKVILYFSSTRPGLGWQDIYTSTRQRHGTFGPAVLVSELSTTWHDARPAIRHDGLELFFDSNRPGTLGALDLWVSTRSSMKEPWSPPVNLGAPINSTVNDVRPAISFDGTELYFHSFLEGGGDLYRSTRTRTKKGGMIHP